MKIGTRVKIKNTSKYYKNLFDERANPRECKGTVVDNWNMDLGIIVEWDTGFQNGYNPSDLEIISEPQ